MNNKFFNDAIIGNKNIRATFSNKGELLRAYYPNVDFKQFVDLFHVGMKHILTSGSHGRHMI